MTIKSFLLPSLTGTIVLFLLGYLFYGIVFHQDFDNEIITAQPIIINPPRFPFLIAGNLVGGILLTLLISRFKSITDISRAFVGGFMVYGLMGLYHNLILYGRTDIITAPGILIDSSILAVMGGVAACFVFQVHKWLNN